METKCIVLDEPTAMLDPRGRKEVMDTIQYLNREKGITIVLITHYMDEAVQAGRVVVMDEGEILMDGTPREVFSPGGGAQAPRSGRAPGHGALLPLKGRGDPPAQPPSGEAECAAMFRRYLLGEIR